MRKRLGFPRWGTRRATKARGAEDIRGSGPPDFVGVGAQRSGTSWWFSLLQTHPKVVAAAGGKELHFFENFWRDEFSAEDIERYHAQFPRPKDAVVGEWTPRYMHDFWTPHLLSIAAPAARLLVMLRDPVERYRSGVEHDLRTYARTVGRSKLIGNSALNRSCYYRQLCRLLDYFPRSQLLVLQYEQCVANPLRWLNLTFDFLGIPAVNPAREELDATVGATTERSPLPAHIRKPLVDHIAEDVQLLAGAYPEIDVSLWPDFEEITTRSDGQSPTGLP
jgi:hypothetical protein